MRLGFRYWDSSTSQQRYGRCLSGRTIGTERDGRRHVLRRAARRGSISNSLEAVDGLIVLPTKLIDTCILDLNEFE